VLRTLAGEDEDGAAAATLGRPAGDAHPRGGDLCQPVGELGLRPGHQREPVLVVGAAQRRGVAHRLQRRRRAGQERRKAPGQSAQGVGCAGGQDEQTRPVAVVPVRRYRPVRRLLEDDVRVGTADPEAVHAGDLRPTTGRPWAELGLHGEPECGKVDVVVRRAEVQGWRELPVVQRERDLHQPRHTGGGFEVTEIRLDRADRAAPVPGRLTGEHRTQRPYLDGITERRAGAVGLDIPHPPRRQAGVAVGLPDHPGVRLRARRGQTV
jgi:hypothetical protein